MNEGVAEAFRKRGIEPSQVSNFKSLSDEEIKGFSMDMLVDAPRKYAPHFLSKFWHLIGATPDDPFHLGDHPVVLDTTLTAGAVQVCCCCAHVSSYPGTKATLNKAVCKRLHDEELSSNGTARVAISASQAINSEGLFPQAYISSATP